MKPPTPCRECGKELATRETIAWTQDYASCYCARCGRLVQAREQREAEQRALAALLDEVALGPEVRYSLGAPLSLGVFADGATLPYRPS